MSHSSTNSTPSIADRFFAPLWKVLSKAVHQRVCPAMPDQEWLPAGIVRTLGDFSSGRDFLQRGNIKQGRSTYFEGLKSKRRRSLVAESSDSLARSMRDSRPDALAEAIPELDGFEVYAGDGHWHGAAVHDSRYEDGKKYAVGHLYGLDLRCGALFHIGAGEGKKEHDLSTLKRVGKEKLRRGAKKGTKVIYIWDKASIDMQMWYHWKQTSGIYFISLAKDNMHTERGRAHIPFDRTDSRNVGVTADFHWAGSSTGVMMRVIEYKDPPTGEEFQFITSLMDRSIPPGVIAQLYRMRWDIEKVFDEVKNSVNERKAWASSQEAKEAQANFICLTHNLMRLMEEDLESNEGIRNEAEERRAKKRLDRIRDDLKKSGKVLPELYEKLTRITKISVKFIRWLRSHLIPKPSENGATEELRQLFAQL
jgi:hypothetical protein